MFGGDLQVKVKRFDDGYFDEKFFSASEDPEKGAMRGKLSPHDVFFINKVLEIFPEKSLTFFDVGGGLGWRAKLLFERGRDVEYCDISKFAIENSVFNGKGFVHDITKKFPPKKYDIVICNRVLGYLEESGIKRALRNLKEIFEKYLILSVVTADHRDKWIRSVALQSRKRLLSKKFYLDLFRELGLRIDKEKTFKIRRPAWDNVWVFKK